MPSVQTPQTEQANDWMLMEPECWDPKGPIIEALRLLALIETGDTVDNVRRLIAVLCEHSLPLILKKASRLSACFHFDGKLLKHLSVSSRCI